MAEADAKWQQLAKASESSWEDLKSGVDLSMEAMSEAFASVKQHFSEEKSTAKKADESADESADSNDK